MGTRSYIALQIEEDEYLTIPAPACLVIYCSFAAAAKAFVEKIQNRLVLRFLVC